MGSGSSLQSGKSLTTNDNQSKSVRSQVKDELKEIGKNNNNITATDGGDLTISQKNISSGASFRLVNGKKTMVVNPSIFKARRLFMNPVAKKKPAEQKLVIKKQNNGELLKELYRRMDPSVNKLSTRSVVGEAEIAIKFKLSEKCLLIRVGRVKGLSSEVLNFPNPYLSIDLYEKNNPLCKLSQQTAVKQNTCNPVFQEILTFPIREEQIANSNIKVSVWDKNSSGANEFLGETIIDLCKLNLNAGSLLWYNLKPQTDLTITGDLDVTMSFDPVTNNLKVLVHSANDLKIADKDAGTSNPFVRVYITGIPSKQDSKSINETLNPEWEEMFEFDVHADEFSRRIVVLNVLSKKGNGEKPTSLGDVHISLSDYTPDMWGIRRSLNLKDLRNAPYVRSKWSEEGVSMELKEAMKAHAIYGYPKFLFKEKHQGRMVVSCYSEKARTQARMVISNGTHTMEEVQM